MQTTAQQITSRDFGKKIVKSLTNLGITFIGAQWLPDASGSYANGETGYVVDNNGQSQVRTYLQVLSLAAGAAH